MQAVILAGGRGERLKPLTDAVPKPMVLVGGKPIIEHVFRSLPQMIDEVILVVGYRREAIEDYFGKSFGNITIRYAEQAAPMGTAHALLCAKPFLKEGFFLLASGDDLYHHDDFARGMGRGEPIVFVATSDTPERFGACVVDGNGCVSEILEKRKNPPTNVVNTGAYILHYDIFETPAPKLPNGEWNLAEQVGNWAKTRPVYAEQATRWLPVNNIEELEAAEKMMGKAKNK